MNAKATTPPEPAQDGPAESRSQTRSVVKGQPAPQAPHERDESASTDAPVGRDIIRQAHDDVTHGLADTSRGEATQQTYEKHLRSKTAPARQPKR